VIEVAYPTILEVFKASVKAQGAKRAIITLDPEGKDYVGISFDELDRLSGRVAAGLAQLGVKPGEKVAILSKPRPEWAAAMLGILKAGAVVVPLDALLKRAEIHRLLAACDTVGVIVSQELYPMVEGLALPEFIVNLDSKPEGAEDVQLLSWEELLVDKPHPAPKVKPDDLAFLLNTSGTTGDAKPVMLAHENITANLSAVLERLDVTADDVVLSIAPWNHSFGLAVLIASIWCGATYIYTNDYANLAEVMRRYRVSILVAVPKLFQAMYQRVEATIQESVWKRLLYRFAPRVIGWLLKRRLTGGRLRFFLSGSAPLSPEVIRGFRGLGVGMIEGYGMTEASPVLSFSTPFNDKAGSVGPALSNVEVKLIDPDGEGVGELLVRGPNIMRGYYKNPERTREVLDEEGWLHTGDLAYIDKEGWLYLKGRRKSLIVLATGKNVYPEEIEWELGRSPLIEEILVRGVRRGETEAIQALVYPNWEELDKSLSKDEVRKLIWEEIKRRNKHLASYKRIKSEGDVIIVDEPFEKTSLRDIKRFLYTAEG
jgi:long-chain acyl-CoA synthetase